MRVEVAIEGRTALLDVERSPGGWRVRLDDGAWQDVPGAWLEPGELAMTWSGRRRVVGTHVEGDRVALQVDAHPMFAEVTDPRRAHSAMSGAGQGSVSTPMPGVVVRIPVAVGQEVHAGQVLVVVEAMKMENEFKAPFAGVVAGISVQVGQALEANALLVTLTAV